MVATRLPHGTPEGGEVLVTVLQPWRAAKVMRDRGDLAEGYVAEHLCEARFPAAEDLTALTLTVRHALDRTEET